MTRTFLCSLLVTAAAALLLVGCGGDTPRTQVTLFVDADTDVRADTVSMRVEFSEPGATTAPTVEVVPMAEWPVTFALIQGEQQQFVAHVYALDAEANVVAEGVAWSSFVPESTRFYYLFLERTPCTTAQVNACADNASCGDRGACTPAVFTAGEDLPAPPAAGQDPDPCAGIMCTSHEACRLVAGEAACSCRFPYTGALCDACAPGWVLGGGGVCEPACLGTCGTHEVCNDQLTVPACECAVGYDRLGPDCTWAGRGTNGGGILAHDFESAVPWSVTLATIETDTFGPQDGSASFRQIALCGAASVAQRIQMPSYADAEPLVMVVNALSNAGGGMDACDAFPAARFGDAFQPLPFSSATTRTARRCAGAAAYGPNLDFALVPDANTSGTCFGTGAGCTPVTIDNVSFQVAAPNECPVPGVVTNGSFSEGSDGWVVSGGASLVSAGKLLLQFTNYCQAVQAATTLSFPTAAMLPNPALRMQVRATLDESLGLSMDGTSWTSVRGTGATVPVTLCIPPWAQGTVRRMTMSKNVGGTCATPLTTFFEFDDVEFVSDAACAGEGWFDGGFEAGGPSWSYVPSATAIQSFVSLAPDDAHSGLRVFRFMNSTANVFSWQLGRVIQVPEVSPGMVPVVRLWARNTATNPTYTLSNNLASGTIVPDGDWREYTVCLDPATTGQEAYLRFDISRGANATTGQLLFIDDVSVGSAASCL